MASTYRIKMTDGPHDGEVHIYPGPLPKAVVFQDLLSIDEESGTAKTKLTEYERVGDLKGLEVEFKWRPTE